VRASPCVRRAETGTALAKHTILSFHVIILSLHVNGEFKIGALRGGGAEDGFMASSFFLESERRIMALLMVMTLCLLVYSALEWRIRRGLQAQDVAFPDQKGNPIQRPTARWVFESFLGIHVLFEGQRKLVLNMKERHNRILAVLGQRGVSAIMGFQPDRMMNRPDERLAVLSHLMLGETQSYAKIMHYSDDGGKTWYKNATIAHDGYHFFCEGALVILDGGEELARVMRENHSGGIPSFVAFSQDNGDT